MAADPNQVKVQGSGSAPGLQWAPPPQAQAPMGCPPGLAYLTQIDQVLIHQQIELFEALTNIEMRNKYQMKNSLGQQIYFAYEESEFCERICCKNARGFSMHIMDNNNQEVIRVQRPFKCCAGCCWCADPGSCCSMEVTVESPPGQVVGYVKQSKTGWTAAYEIQDANQQPVLNIQGPCCPCQTLCCTGDVDFDITTKQGDQQIGRIAKQWGGFFREVITKADNFCVQFPMDLDVKVKATLLGASFLIDFMLFEQEKNN